MPQLINLSEKQKSVQIQDTKVTNPNASAKSKGCILSPPGKREDIEKTSKQMVVIKEQNDSMEGLQMRENEISISQD